VAGLSLRKPFSPESKLRKIRRTVTQREFCQVPQDTTLFDWQTECPKKSRAQKKANMILSSSLDIFRNDVRGNPVWIDTVEDLNDARYRMNQFAQAFPGGIFCFRSANAQRKSQVLPVRIASGHLRNWKQEVCNGYSSALPWRSRRPSRPRIERVRNLFN
jgi:hypothetical protein